MTVTIELEDLAAARLRAVAERRAIPPELFVRRVLETSLENPDFDRFLEYALFFDKHHQVADAGEEWTPPEDGPLNWDSELGMHVPLWTNMEKALARAKSEILADVAAGTVPRTCSSFKELHDYVDANYYGGPVECGFEPRDAEFWDAVQGRIDKWITSGALLGQHESGNLFD